MIDILKVFREQAIGLTFTTETAVNGSIKFLDVELTFGAGHICWQYSPRSVKPLLDYRSAHSKVVKNGIAISALRSALTKSCEHMMEGSVNVQLSKLRKAGYPNQTTVLACSRLLRELKKSLSGQQRGVTEPKAKDKGKFAVIPYVHGLSHRLKKVGARHEVKVVFSPEHMVRGVCPAVRRRIESSSRNSQVCGIHPTYRHVPCASGVVYSIPLSCGRVYVGQTGRCLNLRLNEHRNAVKGPTFQ